jgi:hypothetical protein
MRRDLAKWLWKGVPVIWNDSCQLRGIARRTREGESWECHAISVNCGE